MALSRNLFSSRVARRIFVTFALASLLPLLLFAFGAYQQVSSELQAHGLLEVRALAKRVGLGMFDQLQLVHSQLQLMAGVAQRDNLPDLMANSPDLQRRVRRVFWLDAHVEPPSLQAALRERLMRESLVVDTLPTLPGSRPQSRLFLSVPVAQSAARLVAELDTDVLWSAVGATERTEVICLIDVSGVAVYCNQPVSDDWLAQMRADAIKREPPRMVDDPMAGELMSAVWTLFLKPHYGVSFWYFAVGSPESHAMAPLRLFRVLFPIMVLLVLSVSLLLSIRLVRGNLRPLESILDATRRLGHGDFSARADVRSRDEFEQVARAFNRAAQNLGRNFEQVHAMADLEQGLRGADSKEKVLHQAMLVAERVGKARSVAVLLDREHGSLIGLLTERSSKRLDRMVLPAGSLPQRTASGPMRVMVECHPFLMEFAFDADEHLELFPVLRNGQAVALLVLAEARLEANERALLRQVTDIIAMALHNMTLTQQLYYQAKYDSLTGLLNRVGLAERAPKLVRRMLSRRRSVAVMIFDLDHFKDVNDSLGHAAGDQLLVEIAERIKHALQDFPDVAISRFSGDEFVLIFGCPRGGLALVEVNRVETALDGVFSKPFNLAQRQVVIGASKGLVLCHSDHCDIPDLLQKADMAMYRAKKLRHGRLSIYNERLSEELKQRLDVENALKFAIEERQLSLFYQPIVDAASGRVKGAEALLRWHRDDGLVSPAIFIPIVEELGLIHEFGLWVFEQVCRDLVRWRVEAGDFYASVNLSAVQIEDNRLPKKFANVLRRTGVDPRLLALEITETAVMQDLNTGTTVLSELRELGMELLVDDFGTGHASFKYLRNLPIDGVKVDQLFVGGLPSNVKDAAIVSAVAVLTRDLGVRVVAEGVETEEQREFLLAHGLSVMQGFLFSRPLPVAQFEREVFGDPLRRPAKAS